MQVICCNGVFSPQNLQLIILPQNMGPLGVWVLGQCGPMWMSIQEVGYLVSL